MRIQVMLCLSLVLLLVSYAFAEEKTPKQILDKVAAQYNSLLTYQSEGTVRVDEETASGEKIHMVTSFSMRLKKPNLYLITWNQEWMPGKVNSYAVWNAGAQSYLYTEIGSTRTYCKMMNDEMALASATGISSGAAHTIPSLFFSELLQSTSSIQLTDPKLEKIEKLGNEDCYVVSGGWPTSRKRTFWISTQSYLIKQSSYPIEPLEAGAVLPTITDRQVDEYLEERGRQPSAEERAKVKDMVKEAQENLKNSKIKGVSCTYYAKISTPDLNQADFEFKMPKDAVLESGHP